MPTQTPLIIIFRPDSQSDRNCSATANRLAAQLYKLLTRSGCLHEILRPATLAEATDMARKAAREHRIVAAAGGDGTINAVAKGLAGSECCLGIVPLGSGNDTARGLGIPRSLPVAVRLLKFGQDLLLSDSISKHVHGKDTSGNTSDAPEPAMHRMSPALSEANIRKIDTGDVSYKDLVETAGTGWVPSSFKKTFFINTIGTGFDGQVASNASRIRMLGGKLKYMGGILQSLFTYRACEMTVNADDERFDGRFLMATVANGPYEGGGIPIAPAADHGDGSFHLILIRDKGILGRIPLLLKVLLLGASEGPGIIIRRCSFVRIECDRPLTTHADGEVISRTVTQITAEIQPAALNIICASRNEVSERKW